MDVEHRYILGAGGMAREVLSIYNDCGLLDSVAAFIVTESKYMKNNNICGKRVLGPDALSGLDRQGAVTVAAIGSPLKKTIVETFCKDNIAFDTVIHPTASIGMLVEIGEGTIICPNSTLTVNIQMGKHCIVNINSSVSHDCRIGDYVTICPGASIAGGVTVGYQSWIGVGAAISNNIVIGSGCFIGAGAVITSDVEDNTLTYGKPGKVIRRTITEQDWQTLVS